MKKLALIFLVIAAASFFYADLALADFPNWGQGGLVTCSGAKIGELEQCTSFCDVLATGKNIIEFIMTIALLVMAPIFLLVGGVMLIAGGANPGLHSKGVAYIKTTIIGIIIVLLSFAIVNTFIGAFDAGGKFIKGFGTPFECKLNGSFKFVETAYADEFTIDTSIPGVEEDGNPIQMIAGFYSFALAISGILAVAVILYGAIKYMASPGSAGGQSDAKEWITSALLGILLLAGAYLILNTINPELTILRLPGVETIRTSTSTGSRPLTPGSGSGSYGFDGVAIPTGTYSDVDARAALSAANISVNKKNCTAPAGQNSCSVKNYPTGCTGANCKYPPECTDCTSLSGASKRVIEELIAFKKNCDEKQGGSCDVMVTGGTEAGHSENSQHRINGTAIDISYRSSVTSYITLLLGKTAGSEIKACVYHQGRDGNKYMLENSTCPWRPAAHWHIEF